MNNSEEILDNKVDDLYMVFVINNQKYALSSKYITEIIEILPITKVPFLPEYMKGIINLRSTIIPVMDARMRFGMEPIEYSERTCIIIIENEANKIGLIVDAVNEVLTIPPKQIMESTKEKNDLKESFVNGISQINNDIQLILDCDSLVNIVGDMSNEINE
ncbi:MAG: chemotaxis protein CheW [Romboutsia timonensis]|uniref:chemotaxis protein CheW n=1 Tax=Romboutsia timonensis TaxID=1776391 RepID=UPI002A75F57F|nr:chemotaxis protein CheW [Romboutsia timonensis]MDY3000888.1 chemotaxis protein CheW [Romboutsia timonensis]